METPKQTNLTTDENDSLTPTQSNQEGNGERNH